ncbi:hypothetical protein GQ53DRAFT_585513, partial [Thozetella sp. PMI_491]
RPQNTTRAYVPKQEEFRAWCWEKQYADGETVTEDKMLLFLVEAVAPRPLRRPSKRTAPEVEDCEARLVWSSVRGYITAIKDLWTYQVALGMNTNPNPRGPASQNYIKTLQREEV